MMSNKNVTAAAGTSSGATRHLPHGGRHPVPQTPEEMQRDTLGVLAGICRDMERCAMDGDVVGLKTHYGFFKTTMGRLDVIMTSIRQVPREL